jgi:hypothetical protein
MTLIVAVDMEPGMIILGDALISGPNPGKKELLLPTFATPNEFLGDGYPQAVHLERKVITLSPYICVGWAGDREGIRPFFERLYSHVQSAQPTKRQLEEFVKSSGLHELSRENSAFIAGYTTDGLEIHRHILEKFGSIEGAGTGLSDFKARFAKMIVDGKRGGRMPSEVALAITTEMFSRQTNSGWGLDSQFGAFFETIVLERGFGFEPLTNCMIVYRQWWRDSQSHEQRPGQINAGAICTLATRIIYFKHVGDTLVVLSWWEEDGRCAQYAITPPFRPYAEPTDDAWPVQFAIEILHNPISHRTIRIVRDPAEYYVGWMGKGLFGRKIANFDENFADDIYSACDEIGWSIWGDDFKE